MDLFPPVYSEEDKMIAQTIRRFVDQEVMPVRAKIDDDHDHELINGILKKLGALGIFTARARDENDPTLTGPSPSLSRVPAQSRRNWVAESTLPMM